MKRYLIGLIVGVMLGTTSIATATQMGAPWSHKQDGYWCKTNGKAVLCVPTALEGGYGVAFSRDLVVVVNANGKKVLAKAQPGGAYGP